MAGVIWGEGSVLWGEGVVKRVDKLANINGNGNGNGGNRMEIWFDLKDAIELMVDVLTGAERGGIRTIGVRGCENVLEWVNSVSFDRGEEGNVNVNVNVNESMAYSSSDEDDEEELEGEENDVIFSETGLVFPAPIPIPNLNGSIVGIRNVRFDLDLDNDLEVEAEDAYDSQYRIRWDLDSIDEFFAVADVVAEYGECVHAGVAGWLDEVEDAFTTHKNSKINANNKKTKKKKEKEKEKEKEKRTKKKETELPHAFSHPDKATISLLVLKTILEASTPTETQTGFRPLVRMVATATCHPNEPTSESSMSMSIVSSLHKIVQGELSESEVSERS